MFGREGGEGESRREEGHALGGSPWCQSQSQGMSAPASSSLGGAGGGGGRGTTSDSANPLQAARRHLLALLSPQMLEEKFDTFRKEAQSLGQAKVQALRELADSLERMAPRCTPQIQAQRSRIEAAWERLERAIKARILVSAPLGQVRGSQGAGASMPSAWVGGL